MDDWGGLAVVLAIAAIIFVVYVIVMIVSVLAAVAGGAGVLWGGEVLLLSTTASLSKRT